MQLRLPAEGILKDGQAGNAWPFWFGHQRLGPDRCFSLRPGAEDRTFGASCPARRLSFASSASPTFFLAASALALESGFLMDRSCLGALALRAGSNGRDGGTLAPAKYRARRNCFANSSSPRRAEGSSGTWQVTGACLSNLASEKS